MSTPDGPVYPDMSNREYAAIHLGVPDSGEPWLDKMILEKVAMDHAAECLTCGTCLPVPEVRRETDGMIVLVVEPCEACR